MAAEAKSDVVAQTSSTNDKNEAVSQDFPTQRYENIMERHKELLKILNKHGNKEKKKGKDNTKNDESKDDSKKAENSNVAAPSSNSWAEGIAELMSFNGFYSMSELFGVSAYFAIDTNMMISEYDGKMGSIPIIDILYPTIATNEDNGVLHSYATVVNKYVFDPLAGDTFKDNVLTIPNLHISFTFNRLNDGSGIVSSFKGTIGESMWYGVCPNNAIPFSTWQGTYRIPLYIGHNKAASMIDCLKMEDGYKLFFDYGSSNGKLSQVTGFVYNLNMYVFTFAGTSDADAYTLIMGTGAGNGLICNNMNVINGKLHQRTLETIPITDNEKYFHLLSQREKKVIKTVDKTITDKYIKHGNVNNNLLTPYSGYYQINGNNILTGAFISIESKITYVNKVINNYDVIIGISLNGVTSKEYTFDSTMSFDGKRLSIPNVLEIDIKREYDSNNGSIVQLSNGILYDIYENVTGFTHFNPVTLEYYLGNYWTIDKNKKQDYTLMLGISKDKNRKEVNITYQGSNVTSFVYVPIMYIVGYHDEKTNGTVVYSLGTDGINGNTGMITNSGNGTTQVVYASPNGFIPRIYIIK